jgi:hypothetical protein
VLAARQHHPPDGDHVHVADGLADHSEGVLGRLGGVGDLQELARGGVRISEAVRFDDFYWLR